jgi:hypothetical protein
MTAVTATLDATMSRANAHLLGEVAGGDADEQDATDAKPHATHLEMPQGHSCCRDETENEDGTSNARHRLEGGGEDVHGDSKP